MTRDDIIRMAHEAGLHLATETHWMPIIDLKYAEKFAELVAAAERETCAKLCEKIIIDCDYDGEAKSVAEFLADEIRWRVESEVADMQENELKQKG